MTHSPRPRLRKSMGFPVAVGFGISSLVLGTLPAYADSDREPVAQYSFTQPSGQTVTDTSGNNNDAQLVGDENWNGGYLDLSGNTHVELPDGLLAEAEAATIVVETSPQSITGAEFLWNIGGSGNDATGQMFIHPGDARLSISSSNYAEENTAQSEKDFKEDSWQSIAATIEPNDDDTSTLKL